MRLENEAAETRQTCGCTRRVAFAFVFLFPVALLALTAAYSKPAPLRVHVHMGSWVKTAAGFKPELLQVKVQRK